MEPFGFEKYLLSILLVGCNPFNPLEVGSTKGDVIQLDEKKAVSSTPTAAFQEVCQKAAKFKVTYPAGGENFCAGDFIETQYETGSTAENVHFDLVKSTIWSRQFPLSIGRNKNDGRFGLPLPRMGQGVRYLKLRDDCDPDSTSISPPFVIVDCEGGKPPNLPIAEDGYYVVRKGVREDIPISGIDIEGRSLNYPLIKRPVNGSLRGTAPDFTFQANANYVRPLGATGPDDFFTFRVRAGGIFSNTATVELWFAEKEVEDQ